MAIAFEAVVNRDIPGKGVINSLLGFDPNDRAPVGYQPLPVQFAAIGCNQSQGS
jgi:hypothetical protein